MKTSQTSIERNGFINQLQQDLYYAQQKAISEQHTASLIFLNTSREYVIVQGQNILVRRKYPGETTVTQGTLALNDIVFIANGNSRKSGYVTVHVGSYRYRIVVLLGKGRFYIEQQ